ncbi:uncharacterized protein LOC141829991 isoform X1 [Curcuma longa]|uniref:uncharacterized protein LOC141829991 isoform X1 n=1 Tax=Curcuma longa TaxID=136217 RepID=UPI003D9F36DE
MATAAASGDDDEWVRHAYHNPDLVAAVLLSFRLWCPEAEGDEKPSTSAPPSVCALEWGTRRKRSRLQIPRIFPLTQEEEEEAEERKISAATAAAEVEAEEKNRKEKKRRASPQSPLEGYSSASASGGEEGAKAGRSAGVSIAGGTPQRGSGGGGDEHAGTDGFLLHPMATNEKNDESGAAGRANVAAGREGETCQGDGNMAQSFGAAEGGERQTKVAPEVA